MQLYDISFNQRPFKNLALSNQCYTAYTTTAGKDSKNTVTVNFFVDKKGYVSALNIYGNTKSDKQASMFTGVLALCLLSCGVHKEALDKWTYTDADQLFIIDSSTSIKLGAKTIHIDSKRDYSSVFDKYDPYIVSVYSD